MDNNNDIIDVIQHYYFITFKNNLELLDICNKIELDVLGSFFCINIFEKNTNTVSKQYLYEFKKFDLYLYNILEINIKKMCNQELKKRINIFFSDIVFTSINKSDFICPHYILSDDLLTTSINRSFLKKILYKTILTFINLMLCNLIFYKKNLNISIFYSSFNRIENNLRSYHDIFLNFYNRLINKYDTTCDYIFPIYNTEDNNIYFSKVLYNNNINKINEIIDVNKMELDVNRSDDNHPDVNHPDVNQLDDNHPDVNQLDDNHNQLDDNHPDDNQLDDNRLDKAGSDITSTVVKIRQQLDDIFNNNIKHIYTKEELKQLESLLENTKINSLIARKELKLSPGFNIMIKNVLNEKNSDEEKKKYFNEIFDLDNNQNLTKEDLYKIYKDEPNKEAFLKYIIDKTMYQNIPKKTENTNDSKIVALVDNIFDKILKEDYNHNSLNLEDDDMKFILMLETLNSIKTSSIGSNSNITVNLYKDVDKTKINKDEISFN